MTDEQYRKLMKNEPELCYECQQKGYQRAAELQLCGFWLYQHHLEEVRNREFGVCILLARRRAFSL